MKIRRICTALSIPIQIFVSLGTPNYRKPYSGMWDLLIKSENGGVHIDPSSCYYVGDAAGRESDHSCFDRLFALNCSLNFYTPEHYFLGAKAEMPYSIPSFNSAKYLDLYKPYPNSFSEKCRSLDIPEKKLPELIILVGPPASGKSFFSHKLVNFCSVEYAIVNQDELRTKEKCLKKAREFLRANKSVIIDNTNRDRATRRDYCKLATEFSITCRCLSFKCKLEQTLHNNRYRQIVDPTHSSIPDFVIKTYFSAYEDPKIEEGFLDVQEVAFMPEFKSDDEKRIYSQFLIEKEIK